MRSHLHAVRRSLSLRRFTAPLILALALSSLGFVQLAGCASAPHVVADARSNYFDAATLDLVRLLPPPPADVSAETRAELDLMLQIQAKRSPAEAARAKADAEVSVYRFADALGDPPAFNAKSLPRFNAVFAKVLHEEGTVISLGKDRFARPRPFALEPRLDPVIATPPNGSYPSGHSMWAHAAGLLLADMVPERRAQILKRADEYSYNRVVAGVHYPSDVEGGKLAGTTFAAFLFVAPEFQADFAAAKSELRKTLKLPPQP